MCARACVCARACARACMCVCVWLGKLLCKLILHTPMLDSNVTILHTIVGITPPIHCLCHDHCTGSVSDGSTGNEEEGKENTADTEKIQQKTSLKKVR